MRIPRYKFISTALAATITVCVLSSCEDDMPDAVYNDNWASDEYFIIGSKDSDSRVAYENEYISTFESGDIVGAFSFDENDAVVDSNVPMTVENRENLNTGQKLQALVPHTAQVLTRGKSRYLFYYPYDASMTIDKARDYIHSVKTDQSVDEDGKMSAYEQSDLLWDYVAPGEKNVHIIFDHAMANILVMVPEKEVEYYKSITVHGQPLTATGINLSTENLNAMAYNVDTDQPLSDIVMTNPMNSTREGKEDEGKLLVFRAAVPACRTLAASENAFITVNNTNSTTKSYRLKKDIDLLPGHNYYFSISSFTPPVIDVEDDDSWVLEVYDPENDLVGYLCREYIYYEDPSSDSNYRGMEVSAYESSFTLPSMHNFNHPTKKTGIVVSTNPGDAHKNALWPQIYTEGASTNPTSSGSLGVNSQAWVFYNLQPGTKNPDLTKGTVLRFVFDIKSGAGSTGYTPIRHPKLAYNEWGNYSLVTDPAWPLPHTTSYATCYKDFQGLFKVRHGHEYLATWQTTPAATGYGYESEEYLEYYMHGSTLIWNPEKNFIEDFIIGDEMVTNQQAYLNGHIAIKKENGVKTAFVSYSPLTSNTTDAAGNGVGYTVIKYMTIGNEKYPLRKVSFNQFWTGKSLRNTLDRDNKPLECFNLSRDKYDDFYSQHPEVEKPEYKIGTVNFQIWDGANVESAEEKRAPHETRLMTEKLPAGYVYPSAYKGQSLSEGGTYDSDIDPIDDPSLHENMALLYNFTAFIDGKLKPVDNATEEFRFPTWTDIARLRRYGGYSYPAKWITSDVKTKNADGTYSGTDYEAIKEGKILKNDAYCANISGLDLRAYGYWPLQGSNVSGLGERCYIFLDATKGNPFYNPDPDYTLEKDPMNWMTIFCFNPWNAWGASGLANYNRATPQVREAGTHIVACHSRAFAAVRVVMSFKNPIGAGSRSYNNRAMMPQRHFNTYIPLELSEID